MKKKIIILIFLIGVILGIGGTIFVPNLIAPYLPEVIHSKGTAVGGVVIAKQQKAAWLLLTVNTPQGAILATFKKKVAEIELLVEKGDTIVLLLREYKPFVDNPIIKQVTKGLAPKVAPVDDLALPPLKKDSSLLLPQSVGKKTIDSKPEMGKAKKTSNRREKDPRYNQEKEGTSKQ